MKSFGNPPPDAKPAAGDNDGKSARSAEYTLAGALIGVCVIGGGAAWWLTRDSGENAPKPVPAAAAPAAAASSTAPTAQTGANWQGQLQQEISKIDREQQQEQSRADANEARLAELQKQRDDLERERQKLAAQSKAAAAPSSTDSSASDTVASARPATTAPAKPKVKHVLPRIQLNTCASPRYPDASRQLNEEGRVVVAYQIDENGKVLSSRIDTSSGSRRLDATAENALAKCKFEPGTANGVNETAWMRVAFSWKLN